MSSHDYYKDHEPTDFDSDDEYLEERVKQTISENSPLTIACKIKADHHQQFGEDDLNLIHSKIFSTFHRNSTFDLSLGRTGASSTRPQDFMVNTSPLMRRYSPYCNLAPMKIRHYK